MYKTMMLLIIVIFLTGCASFYANRYPNYFYSPTQAENIPIYNNFPPQPHDVIGEIGGSGAPASSWGSIGKRLREYAAQMGGDAIVIQQADTPYVGTYNTPSSSTTTSSAYGSSTGNAHISGNNIYGQANWQVHGQSNTTYYPGTSIPMYGKSVMALVIKFKKSENISSSQSTQQDVATAQESSLILGKAWDALAANDLKQVLAYVNKISDLYSEKAKAMQNSLVKYPEGSKDKIFTYWALNDVGTGLFLLGAAYEKAGKKMEAAEAYRKLISEYYFAQCWDPQGWFWKPAEAAKEKLAVIEK